jgi:hypothetical protein
MPQLAENDEEITEIGSRFPEKAEYLVSPHDALQAIRQALIDIAGFREKDMHLFRDVIRPLVPEKLLPDFKLFDNLPVSYKAMVNFLGHATAVLTLFGLHARLGLIADHYRLVVLAFVDLRLREKIKTLEQDKPFAWRLQRFIYRRFEHSLGCVVDNLVSLIALGWVFCPGIGEPDKETGFYNRFVFGARCGFLDLGHFFNCAVIAYAYGPEAAKVRAESVEISQRRAREMRWLEQLRQYPVVAPLANLLWGYATSADTIEDRSSDWFGIALGEKMRAHKNNGRIIEFFIAQWPHLVKGDILGPDNQSFFRKIYDALKLIAQLIRHRLGSGGGFDIPGYMQEFFARHGALDPLDQTSLPPGLLDETIKFYMAKYGSAEWRQFTSRGWEVVIPQNLWEQVVRDRLMPDMKNLNNADLPIKIQLDNGEKVMPYFREG